MLLLGAFSCHKNHIREHKHGDWSLDKKSVVGGNVSPCLNVYYVPELSIEVD